MKKRCISCGKSFDAGDLLTVVVDPKNVSKSIEPSPCCEECYSESGISTMAKAERFSVQGGGSIFPRPRVQGDSLDSLVSERDGLREKLLQESRAPSGSFDLVNAGRRLATLDQQIALRDCFGQPKRTDRMGRISD